MPIRFAAHLEHPRNRTFIGSQSFWPKGEEMNDIVSINGCLDALHPGHLFSIGFAAGQLWENEKLVVYLNSDYYLWKREPYFYEMQRSEMLLGTGIVDKVVVFDDTTAANIIRRFRPRVHCVFEEYASGCPEIDVCNEIGKEVVVIPKVGDWSSSKLDGRTAYDLLKENPYESHI